MASPRLRADLFPSPENFDGIAPEYLVGGEHNHSFNTGLRDQHPIKWIVVEMGRYFNELSFVCGYCRGIRGVLNQLGEHRNRLQFESFHHRYQRTIPASWNYWDQTSHRDPTVRNRDFLPIGYTLQQS
jgi:hypothetical protein